MSKKIVFVLIVVVAGFALLIRQFGEEADKILTDKKMEKMHPFLSANQKAVQKVYEDSITYGNEENLNKYLTLIVPKGRKNTQKELSKFFKEYDVKTKIHSFKILKEEKNHILAEVVQKSENLGKKEYKAHVATNNVVFVKEKGKWLIELSTVIDTKFMEK